MMKISSAALNLEKVILGLLGKDFLALKGVKKKGSSKRKVEKSSSGLHVSDAGTQMPSILNRG